MNIIEHNLGCMKAEIKKLEHDYKISLKDPSCRTTYPYSKEGITHTLETIAHMAFKLKVCNECDKFHKCDNMFLCIESIDGSAEMAWKYGNKCYNGLLERYREDRL